MSDIHNELPPGLLSFLYNAVYFRPTNKAVRDDIETEMDNFGLTDKEKAVVLAIQKSGAPNQDDAERFAELLETETEEKWDFYYDEIW